MAKEISDGTNTVKLYNYKDRGRAMYQLAYYEAGKRTLRNFSIKSEAETTAWQVLGQLTNGSREVQALRTPELESLIAARRVLAPGFPLHVAVEEHAQAVGRLGSATLREAVDFFVRHNRSDVPRLTLAEVAEQFAASRRQAGCSDHYISQCKKIVADLAKVFPGRTLPDLRTAELDTWLGGLTLAPKTKNGMRIILVACGNWAEGRGYLIKGGSPFPAMVRYKETKAPVAIYTSEQIASLLKAADATLRPFLAIGAFAGLRVAELQRLDWREIDLERGFITVAAHKAKTRQRRLVPVSDNLKLWLTPCKQTSGPVCLHKRAQIAAAALCEGFEWVKNGLRHSCISYRLAVLNDTARVVPANWQPPYVFNWLENPLIPGSSYAQLLTDVAQARGAVGTGGSSDHFAQQAKLHIGMAIDALRLLGDIPTLPEVFEFLTSPPRLLLHMGRLRVLDTSAAAVFFNHFTEKFLNLAEEELSGVKSTILNILFFYQHPDIAAVFGQPHSTVDFSLTDEGKIFCCSIPQRFDAERGFLNTLMKIAWYAHIKSRFNLSEDTLAKRNLNVLWADEGQRVVTKSELGMADHNQVDQVREAKGCAIFSTQTERSFVPPLGRDIKNTLVDNLGNEIAFCQTNQEDAEILSKRIGEKTIEKTSRTVSRQYNGFSTSRSYQEKEEPFLKPHVLRNLKKRRHGSECVIRHCEKGFQRTVLPFTRFTTQMTGPAAAITIDGQPYDPTVAAKLIATGTTAPLPAAVLITP